jgi:hypothetical protein
MAVYMHLLVSASANANERGRTQVNTEDLASALDLEITAVEAILGAMQERVLEADWISGWEKRQPVKEDNSAERSKAWREAQKSKNDDERNRTQTNETERKRTQDKEEDKDKKRKKYTSDDLSVAEFIWSRILILNPNTKEPNLDNWADSVRLMREADSRTHDEIRSLFAWANQHHFWKANILGPDKLRSQFDQLTTKRALETQNGTNQSTAFQSAADRRAAVATATFDYDQATNF